MPAARITQAEGRSRVTLDDLRLIVGDDDYVDLTDDQLDRLTAIPGVSVDVKDGDPGGAHIGESIPPANPGGVPDPDDDPDRGPMRDPVDPPGQPQPDEDQPGTRDPDVADPDDPDLPDPQPDPDPDQQPV